LEVFVAKELARELINAGVHFGHGVSLWNPKMAPFIFARRGKIHIIDVKKTLMGLLIAKKLIKEVVSSGKDVVFVGTKRQAQKSVEAVAAKCSMHYVSQRWLGGMLTNFRTIRSQLQRLEQLEAMQEAGTLEKESKKQASRLKREMRKIKSNLGGVRKMSRPPGAVVVVDTKKEYIALREAKKLGISTIGIIDTDSDPDAVDVAIPANDDSIRAIELILDELADAVAAGKTMAATRPETVQRPRRPRSRRPVLARATEEKPQAAAPSVTEPQKAKEKVAAEPPKPAKSTVAAPARRPTRVRSRKSETAGEKEKKAEDSTAAKTQPKKSKEADLAPASTEKKDAKDDKSKKA
jgi:small subunit ribosomal protein S2